VYFGDGGVEYSVLVKPRAGRLGCVLLGDFTYDILEKSRGTERRPLSASSKTPYIIPISCQGAILLYFADLGFFILVETYKVTT
jgi:hypothetical protein